MIWGLDVSTTHLGIGIVTKDKRLVYSDAIFLDSKLSLEERAMTIMGHLAVLFDRYPPSQIIIEESAMMFRKGKSTAETIAKLNKFNGMVSLIVFYLTKLLPEMIAARSARSKIGIHPPKFSKDSKGQRELKQFIIDEIVKRVPEFSYTQTKQGNFQPGTADRADALVLALGAETSLI
jgi:hypothetical protein